MCQDSLQNELILILHHVGDIEENISDPGYIKTALKDIKESIERMQKWLPDSAGKEIARIAEDIE